ncbi:hypothetical protein HS088_TW14G00690 [Tripterygium wilfordii]|uniref:Sister chromatid cohesion 1 protein 1 n=1 Tax=Tripterygium wilfordii TaxID=458696 RepID=A0A7J7CRP1_TRIWF|nr:hypothetical protein HS088_TW14G00690 [Tripterygium wilfordii]
MAATMHAKINRKKLDKLNIIKICEEILNPSVPMALRLSGILMGGVVIVYERKVKLLYGNFRLLVEINEAWKVKAAPDPTLLPKRRSQARKEAVTLPDIADADIGDAEQSLNFSNATTMGFQRVAYFTMQLDNIDEPYINNDLREEDIPQHLHQADAENITLFERYDSYQANTDMYNRFERFDIEGDEEAQMNFTSAEHTQMPTSFIPSLPQQDEPHRADDIQDQQLSHQANQQSDEYEAGRQQGHYRQGPKRRKVKGQAGPAMDYEQTIIAGHIYQSWLQDASEIISRRGRKRKASTTLMSTRKITNLMELPNLVLIDDLFTNGSRDVYYPAPLLELYRKKRSSPSPTAPPESSSSLQDRVHYQDSMGYAFEDIHSGVGSQSGGLSIEKLRSNLISNDVPTELMEGLRANLMNNGVTIPEAVMVTPRNSGDELRSIPSSSSGRGNGILSHNAEVNSGRSNKKKPYSSSRHSSSLEPVDEDNPWQFSDPNFKLSRLSENGPPPDHELLVETGPTQTQRPINTQPVDRITDSIREQMKTYFETPGAPQVESLNNLAAGMDRTKAALLFYQTCVLASRDFLRVEQKVPYGDILISKGAKM